MEGCLQDAILRIPSTASKSSLVYEPKARSKDFSPENANMKAFGKGFPFSYLLELRGKGKDEGLMTRWTTGSPGNTASRELSTYAEVS